MEIIMGTAMLASKGAMGMMPILFSWGAGDWGALWFMSEILSVSYVRVLFEEKDAAGCRAF
jgi:hypothetical protein